MAQTFRIEAAKDHFNFASAHFLILANGQREALHGHNYQVSVMIEGELDRVGMLLDLNSFKPMVKKICDALDHRMLIQFQSPSLKVRRRGANIEVCYRRQKITLPYQDVILLPLINTTTELLAKYLASQIRRGMTQKFCGAKIRFLEVGVEETRGQRGLFRDGV